MLIKATTLLLLFFSKILQGNCTNNKLISATTNFIDNLDAPIKITAYVCWGKENKNLLWKNLSTKYHLSIITTNNIQYGLPQHQLFIVDLECDGSFAILKQAEKFELFKRPFKWLLYGKVESLSDFYFGVDSQIYVIDSDSLEIISVYKYSSGSINFKKDYVINQEPKFAPSKRTNLMGTTIKISLVFTNMDSLNHLTDYRDRHIDAISKLNYNLINHLIDYLNATKEFVIRDTWGLKNSTTGLYTGLIGDLQTGLVDLGGTPLFFLPDRIDIIDYFASNARTFMRFIFKAPPLSYVTNVFTLPFDASVWHYCFVMVAVVVICIYIIAKWEWQEPKLREKVLKRGQNDMLKPGIFDAIIFEISAISQQGYNEEPKSIAERIIAIFSLLTLMFLYTSYSANIVALLQSTTDSIKTLDDLLNSRIELGVEDIVYVHYYFENAEEPIKKAIYQQKIAPKGQKPHFLKAEEGIRRVREGSYAFHIELNTGYKIISDMFQEGEKCTLREIEYVNLLEPWLAMQKRSVYGEVIKIGVRKIHENGIQDREVRKIYKRKPQCHASGSNFGSVGMIDCYSAFLLFGTGNFGALLVLVLEHILKKYSNRQVICET